MSSASTKPGGSSGGLASSAGLQSGQGVPAPPQSQAQSPSQGRSGCASQTHRQLSQRAQSFMRAFKPQAPRARSLGPSDMAAAWAGGCGRRVTIRLHPTRSHSSGQILDAPREAYKRTALARFHFRSGALRSVTSDTSAVRSEAATRYATPPEVRPMAKTRQTAQANTSPRDNPSNMERAY